MDIYAKDCVHKLTGREKFNIYIIIHRYEYDIIRHVYTLHTRAGDERGKWKGKTKKKVSTRIIYTGTFFILLFVYATYIILFNIIMITRKRDGPGHFSSDKCRVIMRCTYCAVASEKHDSYLNIIISSFRRRPRIDYQWWWWGGGW